MPEIKPFCAYRYDKEKVKRYENVLTPPYDVISPEQQKSFYKKSPFNFVRIDLRKTTKGKSPYLGAAKDLKSWIKSGVFKPEDEDSFYVYVQDYKNLQGKMTQRHGFFGLMKIQESFVKKHENTLSGPKKDRTALMEKTHTQLSPIMGLVQDPSGKVQAILKQSALKKPALDINADGIRHRLYVEKDKARIAEIQKRLKARSMYIADGHHRFEVANRFRKEHKAISGAKYILTYFCDADRNDFTIYPTHRVLTGLSASWRKRYEDILYKSFDRRLMPSKRAMEASLENLPKGRIALGAYEGGKYFQLVLREKTKDVDATVLDKHFVRKLLGENVAGSKNIWFTRDVSESVKAVNSGKAQIAFYLSKMPIQEMIRISDLGVKLPQKSTYFYPKLLSGLLFYKF